MSTRTRSSPKPKVRRTSGGSITITIPSAGHRPPVRKPKTTRQYIGTRVSKWMGKYKWGRAIRGVHRFGRREAEGWRNRREARAANRPPDIPSRRSILADKARARHEAIKTKLAGTHSCAGCGQDFATGRALGEHTCASSPARKTPTSQAAAGGAAMGKAVAAAAKGKIDHSNVDPNLAAAAHAAAAQITAQQLGPEHRRAKARVAGREWRKHNKAQRKADMTVGQRIKDRAARGKDRALNRAGRCVQCGWTIRDGEDHDCQAPRPTNLDDPAAVAAAAAGAATAATTPSAAATAQQMTQRSWLRRNRRQPTQPQQPQGGTAMTAPAPAAPPANGGASGGGGSGTASAQALVSAMQAWANEMPTTHQEMTAKMNASREAFAQMSQLIGQFQQAMVAKRFHPECAQPLTGVANHLAEGANGFTETLMTIERVYAPLLAHYRSGTPDPGQEYLSDGRVRASA